MVLGGWGGDDAFTCAALEAMAKRRSSEEILPLLLPLDRERLQELDEPCRRPLVEDPFDDIRGEERQRQDAADIGAADPLKIGELADPNVESSSCSFRHQTRAGALTNRHLSGVTIYGQPPDARGLIGENPQEAGVPTGN